MRRSLLLLLLLGGCDFSVPADPPQLVVEGYVRPNQPVPPVKLRRLLPLSESYPFDSRTAAISATIELSVGDLQIAYHEHEPGRYTPVKGIEVRPGQEVSLNVQWNGHVVSAETRIPPPVKLENVSLTRSETPAAALLLDSLYLGPSVVDSLGLDSLRFGTRQGWVYVVEVTLHWRTLEPDTHWWIRTQLRPGLQSTERLNKFFLRPEELARESEFPLANTSLRHWTGTYAIPVGSQSDPMPDHEVRVSVIRSTQDYARFVGGLGDPNEREPPTNVTGALGIFTGLALDSLTVSVQ